MDLRQESKHDLVAAIRERYFGASRSEKGKILDEFVASTGYHRKWAVKLLRDGPPMSRKGRGGRPRVYSSVVVGALRQVAEESGWLCGKRLAPFLEELVLALEKEGELVLEPAVRKKLLGMSASTIDRRLRPYRPKIPKGLATTKPGSLLKKQVPVRVYTPWDEQRAGFVEIDLVAHCGSSTEGHYLNSLVVTDIATGWTECIGVWGKGQVAVYSALKQIRERLPFALLGIDSDNGSEFLNGHLVRWCKAEKITFTRSRPHEKNDQAHVEQKNWSIVRRLIGYDRYETEEALLQLNRVYEIVRVWINHWQPVLKLTGKERVGARIIKRHDQARTPYRRVLEAGAVLEERQANLEEEHGQWGPSSLRKNLDKAIEKLWSLSRQAIPLQRMAYG
jgi:hypothetical protein